MLYFGEPWGAPILKDLVRVKTPNAQCGWCEEQFLKEDRGLVIPSGDGEVVYFHLECFLRQVLGGQDTPGESKRQSAIKAVDIFQKKVKFS